jgi:hypothetical protein
MPRRARTKQKNPAAVALGKLGGAKGGQATAQKLTPQERQASARKAARARWDRRKLPLDKCARARAQ